ncbi:hypothetical protein ACF061_20310 [Streptomyces sp. NPDC015220]|uniref:hypothetical protein n=1 Tax=Streptomyces sp. NPDC015220 TaxID=3364947 RepID=UPI0037014E1D
MDPIVLAAGSALVSSMATDGWEQARAGLVALWRRVRPAQADAVGDELADVRTQVLTAQDAEDTATVTALTGSWQVRLQELLGEDPALADGLRRLLDETLDPVLREHARAHDGSIVITATASGHARMNVAGRDVNVR